MIKALNRIGILGFCNSAIFWVYLHHPTKHVLLTRFGSNKIADDPYIRRFNSSDSFAVREVYSDAIQSQAPSFYHEDQIKAWSSLAWLPGILDNSLNQGNGWVSIESEQIVAFALRYPLNRLALLYCRGSFSRRGHATNLLKLSEQDAYREGTNILYTEASLISYPFLLRKGWMLQTKQKILIAGVTFERYLMKKILYDL